MKKINSIKFKNFKAFYDEETIQLDGKNLLVYGENGSGKSSIFWGLYTFLQSSGKDLKDITKYFDFFDERKPETFDSLKNIFATEQADAFIELETIDNLNVKTIHRIDKTSANTNSTADTTISIANASSDFINYKLLHNFYNVTHKQEINLWEVFRRDIFPFYRVNENVGEKYFRERIDIITKDVPRTIKGRVSPVGDRPQTVFVDKINALNSDIINFLIDIERNANDFLKSHFFDGADVLKMQLTYDETIDYGSIKSKNTNDYSIRLDVQIWDNNATNWKTIKRPHSFLNEAQLTRVAIAVRIGALQTRLQNRDYQILCLDDMLISLDMGNRDKVIQAFLNTENKPTLSFFDKFQKLIFTHDKGFYNLCKQRIKLSLDEKDWHFKEIYVDTDKIPQRPFIDNSTDYFTRAEKHLKAFDYPACANALRQGFENVVFNFLSDSDRLTLDKTTRTTTGKQFNDLLTELKNIHELNKVPTAIIADLFVYKDHILNPFSHDNIDTPAYKEELEKLLALVTKVQVLHTELLKEAKDKHSVIKLRDTNAAGEVITYEIFLKEHLKRHTLLDGNKYFNKCEVIALKMIKADGTVTALNNPYENFKKCVTRLATFLGKTYASDDEILSKIDLS